MYAVYWLIASAVFLLVEIMTLGLTSIWFAGGAVVAAIVALFGVPFWVQMLIFIVVTCLLFALTRPVAKRYLNSKVQKTNTDALIGQTALVKETINNMESKGLVQLNGQDWTARSFEFFRIFRLVGIFGSVVLPIIGRFRSFDSRRFGFMVFIG